MAIVTGRIPHHLGWIAVATLIAGCGSSPSAPTPTGQRSRSQSTVVGSCTVVTQSGQLRLSGDISSQAPTSCVTIQASNVTLDCASHQLPSLAVRNATGVTVKNCVIGHAMSVLDVSAVKQPFVVVSNSPETSLINNQTADIYVEQSDGLLVDTNQIVSRLGKANASAGSEIFQTPLYIVSSSNVVIRNNVIQQFDNYGIALGAGTNNTITANTINGAVTVSDPVSDDGILLDHESGDQILGNTIQNVGDAGIEGVNDIRGSVFDGNTISNAQVTGIGEYYETSWHDNRITNNHVSQTPTFAKFVYRPSGGNINTKYVTDIGLQNNVFQQNTFVPSASSTASLYVDFSQGPVSLPLVVSHNTLTGNNLGASAPPPHLKPVNGFANGGGNTCAAGPDLHC